MGEDGQEPRLLSRAAALYPAGSRAVALDAFLDIVFDVGQGGRPPLTSPAG